MMARLFTRLGYDVKSAGDVATALALARHHQFDLVISDLGLPDGSGLDLMRHLRDRHGLRGIALSGFGMEEDLAQSKAAGFTEHLVKPISFDKLELTIHRVMGAAPEGRHEPPPRVLADS
jgi:CheY-like chemotaxis protein